MLSSRAMEEAAADENFDEANSLQEELNIAKELEEASKGTATLES